MAALPSLVNVLAPVEQEGTRASVKGWLKQVGEHVEEGEPLLELETDKVAMEVNAPVSGVLAEIVVPDGADADKGTVLGRIDSAGRDAGAEPVHRSGAVTTHTPPPRAHVGDTADPVAPAADAGRSIASFDPSLRLSPAVRRLLIETGIEPADVEATGKDGRITAADVERAAERRRTQPQGDGRAPAVSPAGTPSRPSSVNAIPSHTRESHAPQGTLVGRRIPHDSMRRRIAEHMVRSVTVAPHVTAQFEADFGAILAHRDAHRASFEQQGVHLTLTAYMLIAAVDAMRHVPTVNSRWHDDSLEVFDDVNIGVGTSLGDAGLVVPVVHRAQTLSLMGVASRLQQVTSLARAGKLSPSDVQGGTFTISNHGVSGSLTASPIIIHQPQSAILGVGKVQRRMVVRERDGAEVILVRPMSYVTLTIDHRAIDGAQANAWLTRFVEAIERWPLGATAAVR